MATRSDFNAGLHALADAAAEVEPSPGTAESETRLHSQGNRASPTVTDTVAEIRHMMQAMSETLTRQMTSFDRRMDTLDSPRPESDITYQPARLWADRPLNEPLPLIPTSWPDDEELENETESGTETVDITPADDAEGCPLHRVSTTTESLLMEAFTKPMANATRRRWRTNYGMPDAGDGRNKMS